MLDLLTSSAAPLSRDQFDPGHFTAGAFALSHDRVMLVHHRRLAMWLEPGGHVDATDLSLAAAAARELVEETGITVGAPLGGIFDVDVHDIPAAKGEPPHRHFSVSFLFEAASTDVTVADEVVDARWVPLDEVGSLTSDPAVLRAIAKLLVR